MFSVVNDLRTKSLELSRLQRRTLFGCSLKKIKINSNSFKEAVLIYNF